MLQRGRLQFGYIPYPLWRRYWPRRLRPLLDPIWRAIYPVQEDRDPPHTADRLAAYFVRFGLLPHMDMHDIHNQLVSDSTCVEESLPDTPPSIAPNVPVRVPAQWEPMEGVIVNWPVMYPPLWDLHASMVEAIAPVADVQITVPTAMWGKAACLFLRSRGRITDCIDRVRFLVVPTDDIWVRDYGPIIGLGQDGDRVAIKTIYNHLPFYPQQNDDTMPLRWAAHTGIKVRPTHLHTEGGNLWTDGAGTFIMTQQIFNANPGHDYYSLSEYLKRTFNFEKLIITPQMAIERTGHVDLLLKLVDEETALVSAPTTRSSARELREAADILKRETNALGERYRVVELPTPPLYYNWITYPIRRSYTNALTVNGRVLVPIYQLPTDEQALRIYEQVMPDHKIIPIDCKIGANGGGAVHCMTKEIPRGRSSRESAPDA